MGIQNAVGKRYHGQMPLNRLNTPQYPIGRINEAFDAMKPGEIARAMVEF